MLFQAQVDWLNTNAETDRERVFTEFLVLY